MRAEKSASADYLVTMSFFQGYRQRGEVFLFLLRHSELVEDLDEDAERPVPVGLGDA
jgi:hypothetical protein